MTLAFRVTCDVPPCHGGKQQIFNAIGKSGLSDSTLGVTSDHQGSDYRVFSQPYREWLPVSAVERRRRGVLDALVSRHRARWVLPVTTKDLTIECSASHTENGYRCQPWNDVVEESWMLSYPDTACSKTTLEGSLARLKFYSDETSCGSSSENIFTCYSGDDHPLSVQCDGIVDCIGSSAEDELSTCEYRQLNHGCKADEIQCNNGACVSRDSQCIYDVDPSAYITGCRDVSHLRSCDDFECPAYFMKCPGSYCIPLRFRCNGVWDCANGEDEMECSSFVCPAGTYSCRRSTICLPPNQVCDGIQHCSDADDEQFCGVTCPVGCNCTGLVFSCDRPTTQEEDPSYVFSPTARKISIMSVPLILGPDVHTLDEDQVSDEDHVTPYYSFNPVDHPFLAELELVDDNIETIPSTSFTQNQDLYYLSLRQNPIQYIEFGAFANLTNLRVLDIRETTIPSTDAIRKALQEIPSLDKVYADSFAFCCMLDLHPADASDSSGCIAPIDQFSSCDDLLKENTLRVAMWILGISALAGNLCTIGLRVFRRKSVSSTRIQAKLITHLAVSDLLMGVYMLIIAIADQYYMGVYAINADRWRGSVVCRIAGLMSTLSSEVSVFIIMLISVDRVLCIVFSRHHHLQFSNKSSSVCLAVMWAAALVISLVPAFPLNYFGDRFYGRSSVCLGLPLSADRPDGWEYSLSIFLGLNLVCFLITALCYVAIFVTVHRSAKKVVKAKDTGRHVKNGTSMQVKLATRMAMIVGTDFICWMPIIIMGLLASSGAVEIPPDVYAWTAVFILPLNSSLNPYLYTISTVWQQRKAKQRQKELRESEGTQLSVSAAVVALPERAPFNGVPQEKYTHLTTECILTPYNAQNIARNLVPLSKYIEDRGHPPSVVDSSLILSDVRRALAYLKSKSITNFTITEDRIALQLVRNGIYGETTIPSTDAIEKLYRKFRLLIKCDMQIALRFAACWIFIQLMRRSSGCIAPDQFSCDDLLKENMPAWPYTTRCLRVDSRLYPPTNSSLNPYLYTISTVWQQRKAKQRQKELRESEGTQLSVSAAVVALPERAPFNGVPQEKYTHLTTECILTPYNAQNIARNLVPLSKYIEDRGHPPSVVDSSLILSDVRRALAYLKSKSITNFTITEDRIALQLNSNEEVVRAFLVNCDTALLEATSSPKTDKRGSIHRHFMNTLMENIKDLNTANGRPNGQGSFKTGSARKRSTIENTK
nr:G-protein coupled receptor GRL101-like [Lytechinus pictus]